MQLDVFMGERLMGRLSFDAESNQYDFEYDSDWLAAVDVFPLAPSLPLAPETQWSAEVRSRAARIFFENLLPEGQALDDAARAYSVSKASVAGLLAVLGSETAGALRILLPRHQVESTPSVETLRPVPWNELSERIRSRAQLPFSVWDRKVRLSIAGFQDKLAVYQETPGKWFLANGAQLASTHILKPDPANPLLSGLTSNEFFCMRLAEAAGLPTAEVQLFHVPEPVLLVTRFDRVPESGKVHRLPVIDGCQALGLPVGSKYERPFGNSKDVRDIRTGASLARFFELLRATARPAAERIALLRWVIFQVLIGNTDAHAKNLSFLCGPGGLTLAPAYDLVAGLLYAENQVEDTYAMAIGDAFRPGDVSAYEWATLGRVAKLSPTLVHRELTNLARKVTAALPTVMAKVLKEGGQESVVRCIEALVRRECARQTELAGSIAAMAKLDDA